MYKCTDNLAKWLLSLQIFFIYNIYNMLMQDKIIHFDKTIVWFIFYLSKDDLSARNIVSILHNNNKSGQNIYIQDIKSK